jgi:hypothetical protein
MSLTSNTKKIQKLFNDMQKAITNFEELVFPHEYISFDIYKIHVSTLIENIQDDVCAKLTVALFRVLFESETEFNEFTTGKADYISLLINKFRAKSKDDIDDAKDEIESKIITILFNIKSTEKKNLMKELISKLKKQLEIRCEMYYVLLVLLVESNFKLQILTDYLPDILKEKYPDSTFDFSKALNSGIKFDEFIRLFLKLIDREKDFNYSILRFNSEKKEFSIEHKSLDEIADIILTSTSTTKSKKKSVIEGKKANKKSAIEKDDNGQKSNIPNNNNEKKESEISKENCEDKNTDKSEDREEQLKKIIIQNQAINMRLERTIEELKKDNSQLRTDIRRIENNVKKLQNDNKNLTTKLNKNIMETNNKIMKNQKKIASLEFDIKIIGLRDAYKSLIDLLIMLMNLKPYGNIEEKISIISNSIKYSKNKNADKIKALLSDSKDILFQSNKKAHFINFDEDLIKQILFNLSKFSGNKEYLSLIDTLKGLKIENALQKLIENRLEKYQKSKEDFINNQNLIQESIQANPLLANGKGFSTLMNE